MTALVLALLLTLPAYPPAEQSIGTLTLLQGSLTLVRGTHVYRALEGMQVKRGDMLESSGGGFAQLEFSTAILALGPSSRLYILPAEGTNGGHAISLDLILLSGWLKVETAGTAGFNRIRTPLLAAAASGGAIVMRSDSTECDAFLESGGPVSISEVAAGGNSYSSAQANAGQFFVRQKSAPISVAAKPSAAFLESVPREFRDTLPPRKARVSQKPVEAKPDHSVSFDEIEAWLKMPAAWRRGLADRFASRLSDPNFRKQIESHVQEFPEWEPILHPKASSESPQVRN